MPEKSPDLWALIMAYIQTNYNAITGFVMAFFMSMLRAWFLQQKNSYRQRFLDGAICGALTLSCMSLLTHLGVGEHVSTFIGGLLGFVGAEKIREFLFALIRKKISVNDMTLGGNGNNNNYYNGGDDGKL